MVATVRAITGRLQEVLGRAFGSGRLPATQLLRTAWPVVTTSDADPLFAVFFQLLGLASAGREPYAAITRALVGDCAAWVTDRLDPTGPDPRAEALATLATIDALLLVRHTLGADAAERAFAHVAGTGTAARTPGGAGSAYD